MTELRSLMRTLLPCVCNNAQPVFQLFPNANIHILQFSIPQERQSTFEDIGVQIDLIRSLSVLKRLWVSSFVIRGHFNQVGISTRNVT